MARITVEDCLDVVPNRFSLVLVAAERTKQLLKGAPSRLSAETDNKEVVAALREIAAGEFQIDESAVLAEDRWKPVDRRAAPLDVDDELPPEA
jgi:DNA-directed RNA polymerase subunit omega